MSACQILRHAIDPTAEPDRGPARLRALPIASLAQCTPSRRYCNEAPAIYPAPTSSSMDYPVVYDITRLAMRVVDATPNGIDRVDMALDRKSVV